jgi:ADP-ribosylation factor-like protein 1
VDASDKERLGLTRKELLSMLDEEELKSTILLVFANKSDMKGAATEVEVSQALGLHAIKERSARRHTQQRGMRQMK